MKIIKKLSMMLAVPVLLAGCNDIDQAREWTPWKPAVDVQTKQDDFHFRSGQVNLTRAQHAQLHNMVRAGDGQATISARVLTHDIWDHLQVEPYRARINHVIKHLIKSGVPRANIDVVTEASPMAGAGSILTVAVDHSKAKAPVCDGWNYNMGRTVYPDGEPDFGCANAGNLAKMISNPRDLVEGREADSGDVARSDVFTQYYRDDKIRPLLKNEKISGK